MTVNNTSSYLSQDAAPLTITVAASHETTTLDPDSFKGAFRNHAAGVAVISAASAGGPVALTATSVFSISADPPLIVFSLSSISSSTPAIQAAETAVIHLLGSDQLPLAQLCATSGVDRFADTSTWSELKTGEPVFHDVPVWIRCKIVERIEAGQSMLVVLQAVEAKVPEDDAYRPLVYHNRTWHGLQEHSRIVS